MKTNKEIDAFILGLEDDKKEIVISLRELALEIAPGATGEIKWGGLVFISGRAFCGIVAYKKYVSVVFDRGSEIPDPDDLLEGGGKKMRHLKIFKQGDIKTKKVGYYIEQSFKL